MYGDNIKQGKVKRLRGKRPLMIVMINMKFLNLELTASEIYFCSAFEQPWRPTEAHGEIHPVLCEERDARLWPGWPLPHRKGGDISTVVQALVSPATQIWRLQALSTERQRSHWRIYIGYTAHTPIVLVEFNRISSLYTDFSYYNLNKENENT